MCFALLTISDLVKVRAVHNDIYFKDFPELV